MKTSPTRRDFLAAATSAATLLTTTSASAAEPRLKVVVWDERQPAQKQAYENFLGNRIADHLKTLPGLSVQSVALDDPAQGLSDEILGDCHVLIWWGHVRQAEVAPEVGIRIVDRIKQGKLALIALHSAHWSTPFIEAMNERSRQDLARLGPPSASTLEIPPPKRNTVPGDNDRLTPYVQTRKFPDGKVARDLHLPICCFPAYRNDGKPSYLRVLKPEHPIVQGVPASGFTIPHEEMYNEPFHVPEPDEVILEERWETGEWFRGGMLWTLGKGKVFYFRPGHETYPTYQQEYPLMIVANAVNWLGAQG